MSQEAGRAEAERLKAEGNALLVDGLFGAAEARYGAAMAACPAWAVPALNRALARLKQSRWDEAAADARLALRLEPGSVKARFRLGQALFGAGRFA